MVYSSLKLQTIAVSKDYVPHFPETGLPRQLNESKASTEMSIIPDTLLESSVNTELVPLAIAR